MSSGGSAPRALDLAEAAYDLVQVDPRRALGLAMDAARAASTEGDPAAQVAAHHALAWAQFTVGDKRAIATARAGIRIGERHGELRRAGLLRRHLALDLAASGKTRAALRELDSALVLLDGHERARSGVARVAIHRRAPVVDPELHRRVVADARRAQRRLRAAGDAIWEARLSYNLGVLELDRGELDPAETDLRRAHALYSGVGADAAAADAYLAIAAVALRRGEVIESLAALDAVDAAGAEGAARNNIVYYRLMALRQARLLPEAELAAAELVRLNIEAGYGDLLPSSLLEQAEVTLLMGGEGRAAELAQLAARSFSARGKQVHAARARRLMLQARLEAGRPRRASLQSALEAADVLETAGWTLEALRTRLLAARIALALGSDDCAREQMGPARRIRSRGTVADRIELDYVCSLLSLADGKPDAAERSLEAGLRLLDEYQAALGAVELRATASGIGTELSQSGLRIALASRRPRKALAWCERLRANTILTPSVRPPSDPELRRLQAELRSVAAQSRAAEERGRPVRGAAARQAELEGRIRGRSRLIRGSGEARDDSPAVRAAADALGTHALVEYFELDDRLGAVTLSSGQPVLHDLGSADAAGELEWLRFALIGLARGAAGREERAAARANAEASAAALDRLLVEPLLPAVGDSPLVIVPTGPLHALPWSTLPSLAGRPLVVAPSLGVWLGLQQRPRSRRRKVALVAGPRLRYAAAEVRQLAGLHPGATVLHGREATANATLAALDGAALAHLACHGRFRADSPLFSSLELADGPLNVYELQTLRRAPELVVLSACDLAVSSLHPGDELLGLATALLSMGTRTIVASVVPVPDAAAKRLMLALHRDLLAGEPTSVALAQAQKTGAGAGFVCLGSG